MKLTVALLGALALVSGPAHAQTYPFPNAPYAGEKGTGAPSAADQILVQQGVNTHDPVGSPARMTLQTLQGLIGGLPLSGGATSPLRLTTVTGMPVTFRSGVNPATDLVRFSQTATPIVCFVGDSTMTLHANQVAPTAILDPLLRKRFTEDNTSKTITFVNRAIPGQTWDTYISSSTATPTPPPSSWTWTAGQTWQQQVQAQNCDTIVFNFGINDTYGLAPADIKTALNTVSGWTKIPDILIATNPLPSLLTTLPPGTQQWQDGTLNGAGFQRNVALTDAIGMGLPATLPRIGLIDIGRYFTMVRNGYDPANAYLTKTVTTPITGITTFPYNFPATSGTGDFGVSMTFPGQGPGILTGNNVCVNLGDPNEWTEICFDNGNGGFTRARYIINNDAGSSTLTSVNGTSTAVPTGDITLEVYLQGDHLMAYINGTVIFDTDVVAYDGPAQPQVWFTGTPASPNMTINAFYSGTPIPVATQTSDVPLWGTGVGGPTGGNADDHMSSVGIAAIDAAVLDATDFRALSTPTFMRVTLTTAVVAAAGTTQATATAVTSQYNSVTTGTGGVILAAATGLQQSAVNKTGSAINVYPPVGAAIGSGATNAPVSLAAGGSYTGVCISATDCEVVAIH